MSNAPDVLMGLVPLFRAVVRSATDATATTVTADDSGTLFINLSTSAHTYTLPTLALSAGKVFIFFNGQTTAALTITPGTADKMLVGDNAAADSVACAAAVGEWAIVIGDGTWFYCLAGVGTWTASG